MFRSGTREDKQNLQVRRQVLHAIEQGGNETADIADLISVAVLRRHLETMDRLDIEYDFLPRESEILHLHFWDAAFAKLKEAGVLTFETEGKNKGCWVMRRAGTAKPETTERHREHRGFRRRSKSDRPLQRHCRLCRQRHRLSHVEVRLARPRLSAIASFIAIPTAMSAGFRLPSEASSTIRTSADVAEIYNVIDARQSEAQNTVIEALRGLGHNEEADHYTHFSYEMVALTPRCAAELGYQLSDEDKARPYIEVSGRKGFGVKADDLLDSLIASAKKEVDPRHPELSEAERADHRDADRNRRAALLHAQVHQEFRHRLRFQRGAELRRRDWPLCAVRRRARRPTFSAKVDSIPTISVET